MSDEQVEEVRRPFGGRLRRPGENVPARAASAARPRARLAPAWLPAGNLLNVAFLATITLLTYIEPDQWWWSAPILYVPQWFWAVPSVALLAVCLRRAVRASWLPALGMVWVAGPLMGFCWPLAAHERRPALGKLRLLTYNVHYDIPRSPATFADEIPRHHPDLVVMQEATAAGSLVQAAVPTWRIEKPENYLIASGLPMTAPDFVQTPAFGANFRYARFTVTLGGYPVTVYVAHFLTARLGMERFLDDPESAQRNIDIRVHELGILREALSREKGPLIVAGDLNAPMRSILCQSLVGLGLRDAFTEAGRGYGYTYGHDSIFRHRFARIDHILYSSHLRAVSCYVGATEGSDHCPLIADLELVRP